MKLPIEISKEQKTASAGSEIVWRILDQRAFIKVWRDLGKEDEQAADLLYEVLTTLQDKLTLSNREYNALNRIAQLLKAGSGWKPALHLQRNNIFKAADLLGLKLPSGMFASTKTVKTAKVEYKQHGEMVRLTILQAGQGKFLKADEVQKRAAVFQDKVGTALKNSGLFLRWKLEDVWIESTRGGLAFSMTLDAKLKEEITDVYDRSFSKPLKDAFKSQGIAF
jgi:hypothetical protein